MKPDIGTLLDIWWDIDTALTNGDPIWNGGSTIHRQPSCVGGKYGLPLSGTDAKKHRLAMTPTNARIHRQQNTWTRLDRRANPNGLTYFHHTNLIIMFHPLTTTLGV